RPGAGRRRDWDGWPPARRTRCRARAGPRPAAGRPGPGGAATAGAGRAGGREGGKRGWTWWLVVGEGIMLARRPRRRQRGPGVACAERRAGLESRFFVPQSTTRGEVPGALPARRDPQPARPGTRPPGVT